MKPKPDQEPFAARFIEEFIAAKHLGRRIRRLRLRRSMALAELGRRTGLSSSFLSQLETGRVVPTLRNLARIALVFGVDLAHFFEPEPRRSFELHRQRDRAPQPQTGANPPAYFFERLAYKVPDRLLDPYVAEFLPVASAASPEPHLHGGYEFLYVLAGTLELRHGERVEVLGPGDAACFDAGTPHGYRCASHLPCRVLIVSDRTDWPVPQPAEVATPEEPAASEAVSRATA